MPHGCIFTTPPTPSPCAFLGYDPTANGPGAVPLSVRKAAGLHHLTVSPSVMLEVSVGCLATLLSSQYNMRQANFHQVQSAEHTCRKFHCSKFYYCSISNLWNKRCLPLRTVDMRALGVAN